MTKNRKQFVALVLSGLLAFNGSVTVDAGELEQAIGQETAAVEVAAESANELTYSVTDWDLDSLTKWGTTLVKNEDGSVTVQFSKQYSQVFFPIPEEVSMNRLEKVIVHVDSNDQFSVKMNDLNNLGEDKKIVVYGNNVLTRDDMKKGNMSGVSCIGLMNLNVVEEGTVFEKTITGMTFVLSDTPFEEEPVEETKPETDVQANELTYKLADLENTKMYGDVSFETNEDGSTLVSFPKQYNQVSYAIPAEVDLSRLESVIVDVTDKSSLSVKFMADLEIKDEMAVVYGNNVLNVTSLKEGFTVDGIKAVVLMSLNDEFATTVKSITFKMGAPKAPEVKDQTFKLSELNLLETCGDASATVNEDGSSELSFPKQYAQFCYEIPESVDITKVEKLVVNVNSNEHFSVKFMASKSLEKEAGVVYGSNTIFVENITNDYKASDIQSFVLMSLSEDVTKTVKDVTFVAKKQESNEQGYNIYFKEAGNNNPIVTQRYCADPGAMVYDDTVYIYSTNDIFEYQSGKVVKNTYGKIKQINCFSSKDMVNWTDHGPIDVAGKDGAATWANNSWAPCAAHKTIDGKEKFFLYFADNGSGIGVLTSDSPTGPWVDPIGKQLVSRQTPTCKDITWLFDPAVMVDDDGTGYLVFGGGVPNGKEANPQNARVVKLGEDMISLAGDPVMIDAPWLFEDSGINKIGDTYYYTYCTNWNGGPYGNANIAYMTSKDPMGPYEFQGVFFNNPSNFFSGDGGNNHHSLFELNGKLYLAYHARQVDQVVLGKSFDYRSTHVDEVHVDENGALLPVTGTMAGVSQLKSVNPYVLNQAECVAREYGIQTDKLDKAGNAVVIATEGDWIGVKSVDFAYGVSEMTVTAAADEEATIEIRTGSYDGTLIGTVKVPATDGAMKDFTVKTQNVSGERNLFFVFKGNVKMDSWQAKTANIYTFDQLVKAQSYDLAEEVNADGSLSISYDKQWAEIRYEIPAGVDTSKLTKVTVLTEDGDAKKLSIKLLSSIDPATEVAVAYGSNEVSVSAGAADSASYIGIMNSAEGEASYKFSAVVFDVETAKDKGEAGNEVQTDIPDLRAAVAEQTDENFITGVSITGNELSDAKLMGLVTKHFNAVTLGNELKPDANFGYASSCPGKHEIEWHGEKMDVPTFDFSRAEKMLDYILKWNTEHPDQIIKVRGHVLVWHSQTPEWFFHEDYDKNQPYVTPEVMNKRLEWYIESVLGHFVGEDSKYKDLFYGWDVVNEAVSDGRGTYRNESENSSWWAVYHSNEFIINAFRFANKYAPASLELYYNDYNEWVSSKVNGIEQLLKDVKNAEGTRIDGMGMQGHFATEGSPSVAEFKAAATRYGAIVDKIQLTELDFKCSNAYDGTKKTQAAEFTKLAYRYKDIFDAVKELRESGINFANITIWGVIDKNSWLQTSSSVGGGANGNRRQCPLLFDDNYQAKPSYWAFVDPTRLEPEIKAFDIVGIADSETLGNLTGETNVVINGAGVSAKVYTSWNKDWIRAEFEVQDSTVDAKDAVYMYISANGKTETALCERKVGTEVDGGYTATVDLNASDFGFDSFGVGTELKIDFVVANGNKKAAYNDHTLSQEMSDQYFAKASLKPYMMIVKGSAEVDGELDAAWENVSNVPMTINLGSKVSANAKLMWDESFLYVYVDIADKVLNAASANAHEKDSLEIFVDENNHKSDSYEDDDKQYRINYLNEQSFNGKKCTADNITSAVKVTDNGYVVEAKLAWTDIKPEADTSIGLELQINDADGSGKRIGTLNWYDASGQGWSNPGVFGTVKLVDNGTVEPEPEKEVTEIKTALGTWVTGTYSQAKAAVEENAKRIRLTEALSVEAGNTYEAVVSDPAFRMIVRAKTADNKVSTFYLSDKDQFVAEAGVTYFVSVHNVYNNYKDIDFAQYVALFDAGLSFEMKDVTEKVAKEVKELDATFTMGQNSKWVTGTYSQTKAAVEENRGRIRLADALQVEAGKEYKASITIDGKHTQSFRYIIRQVNADGKVTTFYLSDGQKFVAEAGMTYYVSTQNYWSNYKGLDFQKYVELMTAENGLTFDFE